MRAHSFTLKRVRFAACYPNERGQIINAIRSLNEFLDREDLGLLALRLTIGGLILLHGVAKVVEPASLGFIQGLLSGAGLPGFIAYGVYLGEVIAPLLIIIGLFTRLSAVIVAVTMVIVILLVHAGDVFSLNQVGGSAIELQALYLFGALAIALLGSGRFAVKAD